METLRKVAEKYTDSRLAKLTPATDQVELQAEIIRDLMELAASRKGGQP